jgi:hypothetical protein
MGRSLRADAGVYPTAALGLRVAIPDHDSTLEVRGRYLGAGASVACRKGSPGSRSEHLVSTRATHLGRQRCSGIPTRASEQPCRMPMKFLLRNLSLTLLLPGPC